MLARISVFNDLNAALHISDHVCGDDELIEITGPENFTGIADLTINGNQINNIQITCGHAFFRLNLAPGSYVATMATPDTEYYRDDGRNLTCTYLSATTTSNEFKVLRKANIELTVENIVYGENETINVNIDAEGNVTIVLDGRTVEYGLIINNNEIAYTIPKHYLNAGNHAVEVRYNGDTYVICCSKSAEFTVNKTDSSLSVGDVVLEYGNSIKVNVTVEGAKGIVAEIDNKNVNVNGFSVPISGLDVGTHTLSVTAIADANHNNMTKTATINVIKLKTELAANTVVATYNIDKNLVITLKDSNGNALKGVKISVYIKGDKKYTTDKNGQVKINVANLVPKIYAAKISFAGNINYKASSKSVKVTVKKGNTKLIASSKSFTVKATKKVTAILKDSKNRIIKNRYVTFKVAGKSYKVKTDSKGVATATVKLIKKGSFSTVVSFAGDNCYNKCEKTIKVTVK